MDRIYTVRLRARWVHLALLVAVTALVAMPIGAWAGHRFGDVPDANQFHNDVSAIADVGVTKGCNAAGTLYCPDDPVTRGEMAAFMNRLGSLDGSTPPSVNAKTAVNATEADTVDGKHADQLSVQGWVKVQSEVVSLSTAGLGQFGTAVASCPAGATVLGGGWGQTDGVANIAYYRNHPTSDNAGWSVSGENISMNDNRTFWAWAICAVVSP